MSANSAETAHGDGSVGDGTETPAEAAGPGEKSAGSAQAEGPPGTNGEEPPPARAEPDAAEPETSQAEPAPERRAIPPDAEPIRAFSDGAAVAMPRPLPAPKTDAPLTELEKLWKPVRENPTDFTAWTLLIQFAETQCFMEEIREVLNTFLDRYPYCYGYWKKFTDLEKKRGTPETVDKVFERALHAVPLSVDLWLHYIAHMKASHEAEPARVRAAFERAIAACGLEFRSDRLWEQYASWEAANKEPIRALAVYKRAIAVPTLSYRTHFENLEQFVGETPPQELLSVGEFLEARRAVLAELRASEPAPAAAQPSSELLPPGCDEPPPGVPAQLPGLSTDDEAIRLRARILLPLRQLHKETEKKVSLRWAYEEGIKRPYFHVKPMEKAQLKNWKAYLDFEIEQGDGERIRVLFERCMIACTLYEEFWIKYVRYLEALDPPDPAPVRAVFQRACWTHLPKKPAVHLLWANFEEKQGNLERAVEIVERLSAQVSLMEVTLRRIGLCRRSGRLDDCEQMFAEALKNCQHRQAAITLGTKFVRFLSKIRGDFKKAKEVILEAIQHDNLNQRLYMQLADLGFQSQPVDVALVEEAFRMALAAPFELKDRVMFAHRRVQFLEEFGSDVNSLQAAQDEYVSLARTAKAESKKRKAEDGEESGGQAAASPATKRPATAANGPKPAAAASTAAATPARPAKPNYQQPPPAPAAPTAPYSQRPPAPYGQYQQTAQQGYQYGYQYPNQYQGQYNYNYNQYQGQYQY